jgi:hypothetical protein
MIIKKSKMKNLLTYLILIIIFASAVAGCNEGEKKVESDFSKAKKNIRTFAIAHFDTNYTIWEGSVGSIAKFNPPIEPNLFLSSDSLIDSSKMIHFEQVHLGVPCHRDSLVSSAWTYYQLDEDFEVVSYTKHSMFKKK